MRMLILGATGGTGVQLTAQALARGHRVTVLVRTAGKLPAHARCHEVLGDPRDAAQLAAIMAGHDAVLSTLGTAREPTTLLGDCARSTVDAMLRTGVRRIVLVSSALLFRDIGLIGRVVRLFFRHNLADSLVMEGEAAHGALDWTVVRPPRLLDGAATGIYRISQQAPPAGSITRADLATSILDIVERSQHFGEVIGVSR